LIILLFEDVDVYYNVFHCYIFLYNWICKHVNATSAGDTGFDVINVEIDFNYNGEMFCKLKQLVFLVSNFIQPCGSHFIQYFNK
jgi:hypothetical protein